MRDRCFAKPRGSQRAVVPERRAAKRKQVGSLFYPFDCCRSLRAGHCFSERRAASQACPCALSTEAYLIFGYQRVYWMGRHFLVLTL
jgi:hypothetical protein